MPLHETPPVPSGESLDDRKARILRAIVEHYVVHAQPVGSQAIASSADLMVSAATVRNEMGLLERDGFIAQPHTSAGRVPTDKGYRFYVDHFSDAADLPAGQKREVADFFASTARVIDDLLHDTSQLLTRLTADAAVVVGPQPDAARVRSVTIVDLDGGALLAIAVMSNGAIERHTFVPQSVLAYDDADLHAVGLALTRHVSNRTLAEAGSPTASAPAEGSRTPAPNAAEALGAAAYAALSEHTRQPGVEPVFVGGASRLAAEHSSFANADVTEHLLALLEQHVVVVAMMRELLGPGVVVRIGAENGREELRESSLVLAPYLIEGEPGGTVGILGPTRMDYTQAKSAVATVSQLLGRSLSKGAEPADAAPTV